MAWIDTLAKQKQAKVTMRDGVHRRAMKPTTAITLPASFVVTVLHMGTAITPTATNNDILTVAEVAQIIRCKPSSVYNLTRKRGTARYAHPIPVIKLPCGLRFRKSSVLAWLKSQETNAV
jgi:predicted DNA-binding transcriptional regulator AlpA